MKNLIALPVLALAALSLTGCAQLYDTLHNERQTTYEDAAALAADWTGSAAWVPGDATDITVRESSDGTVASLALSSASPLDPADCAETDRLSMPSLGGDWAPDDDDIVKATTVYACGDWAVLATDDGWYGWTPSAPGEQEAAPAA
jgi:hypothetical protein